MTLREALFPESVTAAERVARESDTDVSSPSHYTHGKTEVADFIAEQELNFDLGNVVKYVCRRDRKGSSPIDSIRDLKKAKWYLEHEIKLRSEAAARALLHADALELAAVKARAERKLQQASKKKGGSRGRRH